MLNNICVPSPPELTWKKLQIVMTFGAGSPRHQAFLQVPVRLVIPQLEP